MTRIEEAAEELRTARRGLADVVGVPALVGVRSARPRVGLRVLEDAASVLMVLERSNRADVAVSLEVVEGIGWALVLREIEHATRRQTPMARRVLFLPVAALPDFADAVASACETVAAAYRGASEHHTPPANR